MKFLILLSILCIFSQDLVEVQLLTETYNPLRIIAELSRARSARAAEHHG